MAFNQPRIGIIGGSGLGQAMTEQTQGQEHYFETPFGKPSAPIITSEINGVPIAYLSRHGRGHVFNPSVIPYKANIYALKMLGVTSIIASGAVGSLVEEVEPKHLVIPDQVIDKTFKRENTFFDDGIVAHVDFAWPFCDKLRQLLMSVADKVETKVHRSGTYVCMEGPQFSTRAESLMHRSWGAELIGMTCMPEARLAREAEMCYALVALPTDYDCWKEPKGDVDKHKLIAEIIGNLNEATNNAIELIKAAVSSAGDLLEQSCEHHSALELAIWSDKSKMPAETAEKLELLIKKYI